MSALLTLTRLRTRARTAAEFTSSTGSIANVGVVGDPRPQLGGAGGEGGHRLPVVEALVRVGDAAGRDQVDVGVAQELGVDPELAAIAQEAAHHHRHVAEPELERGAIVDQRRDVRGDAARDVVGLRCRRAGTAVSRPRR